MVIAGVGVYGIFCVFRRRPWSFGRYLQRMKVFGLMKLELNPRVISPVQKMRNIFHSMEGKRKRPVKLLSETNFLILCGVCSLPFHLRLSRVRVGGVDKEPQTLDTEIAGRILRQSIISLRSRFMHHAFFLFIYFSYGVEQSVAPNLCTGQDVALERAYAQSNGPL